MKIKSLRGMNLFSAILLDAFFTWRNGRRSWGAGFGFKTFYLYEEQNGEITGILPLALVRRPFFGAALISTPLCVYGGGLGQCDELEQAAIQKAKELGVQYLELRHACARSTARGPSKEGWVGSDRFYGFERDLSDNHEENLKAIPRKQRAEVRKAIASELGVTTNQDIDLFYKIYSASVSPAWHAGICKEIPENIDGDIWRSMSDHNDFKRRKFVKQCFKF